MACALLTATLCGAQTGKPALLKAADLQADASVLRKAYETLHPGLYRYNKVQLDAAFAALSQQGPVVTALHDAAAADDQDLVGVGDSG